MEKTREQRRCMYIAFVDVVKAFDAVNRQLLFIIIGKLGCPPKFIRIIHKLWHRCTRQTYCRWKVHPILRIQRWGKAGVQISSNTFWPLRSSLTLARFLENQAHLQWTDQTTLRCDLFNPSRLKVKSEVLTEFIREVQYADDIAIFSDTPEGLQSLLTSYNDVANRMGLRINTRKTETMCIGNMAEFFILRWY